MTRFDKRHCDECMVSHWLETTNRNKEVCHGPDYLPRETPTHYTRWNAGGIELHERHYPFMPADQEERPANWLDLGI